MHQPAEVPDPASIRQRALRVVKRKPVDDASAPSEPVLGTPARAPVSKVEEIRLTLRREWRLTLAGAMFVLGIVLVLMGWYGAAYTNIVSEQIPYMISGGLLGLGLIIVAGIMASAAIRDRESSLLRREIGRALANAATPAATSATAHASDLSAIAPRDGAVFAVPGGRSFHLAGCPIIEGKDGVRSLQPREARTHGLEPCKLCTD